MAEENRAAHELLDCPITFVHYIHTVDRTKVASGNRVVPTSWMTRRYTSTLDGQLTARSVTHCQVGPTFAFYAGLVRLASLATS
jgi:hypothetical protein